MRGSTDAPGEATPSGHVASAGSSQASATSAAASAGSSKTAAGSSQGSAGSAAASPAPPPSTGALAGEPELSPVALEALAKAREDARRDSANRAAARSYVPEHRKAAAPPARPSAWWRFGFPIVLVLAVLAVPLLFYAGYETVLNSNEGKLVKVPSDPSQPGWEALTEATPTMLVMHVDDQRKPVGLAVLGLTGENTGSILLIPMNTVLQVPGIGPVRVDEAYKRAGLDGVKLTIEGLLGAGMQETVVLDDKQWADLVTPTAPILVNNRDAVTSPTTGRTLFPKGPVALTPEQVGPYLGTSGANDDDFNRLLRNETFWRAWLAKVAAAPDDTLALPGESDTGFGRFVRKLADSQVEVKTLPLEKAGIPGSNETVSVPVKAELDALVAQMIPFPVSPIPGARPRVRILDGVGTLDNGVVAAPLLVQGGGQIDAVGNAVSFDRATTQLIYHEDELLPTVEKLRAALGVGELVKADRGNDNADVTVILGKDFAALPAASKSSVSTSPPTAIGTTIVGQATGNG